MTSDLSNILVVEDNYDFFQAAAMFFTRPEVNAIPDFANDYSQAMHKLDRGKYDGAMIDCFFPEEAGSDKRELGKVAIDKMLSTDIRGQRVEEYDKFFSQFLDYNDPELRKIARYIGSIAEKNPEHYSPALAIRAVGNISRDVIGRILKEDSNLLFQNRVKDFKDYYDELRKALEKDPANQALGILVAEEAEKMGIPLVLATSTYHHDALTQPIQNYCQRRGWLLVDCSQGKPDEKATPEFWKRVYETLLGR